MAKKELVRIHFKKLWLLKRRYNNDRQMKIESI